MRIRTLGSAIVLAAAAGAPALARPPARLRDSFPMATFDYGALQALYDRYVDGRGKVDYGRVRAHRAEIDAVMAQFAAARPARFATDADRFAFWINAYNVACIAGVVDAYPTTSVRKVRALFGFFTRITFPVAGEPMTLNHIEHAILRKQFRDPRLHFAIVCASESCPRLSNRVYRSETLDDQLNAAANDFLATPSKNAIDPDTGELRLSRIFKWYARDFNRQAGSVRDYVAGYLPKPQAAFVRGRTKIAYLKYDWTLNDQHPVQ